MDKWIRVQDRLPVHEATVLVCSPKGQAVVVFVDSERMNETLRIKGYGNECVDVRVHPYYFCSQETKQHTLKGVTHWMELPEMPYE